MTKQNIIERLQQKDWKIKVTNDQELATVLNVCTDAGLCWAGGEKASEFVPPYPIEGICFNRHKTGITFVPKDSRVLSWTTKDNLTDWFFEEINSD